MALPSSRTDLTRADVVLAAIPAVVATGLGAAVLTTLSLRSALGASMLVATGIVAAELFVRFPAQ